MVDTNEFQKYYIFILIFYIIIISCNLTKIDFTKLQYYLIPIILYIGYCVGDLLSGLYHYFMDTYDLKILKDYHKYFRAHHTNPLSMEKYPMLTTVVEIMPIGIIIGLIAQHYITSTPLLAIIIVINLVICSSQFVHRMAHRRNHEYDENNNKKFYIPNFIKFLQDNNIILNNKEHSKHHVTEVMNYCIANGSTSHILDNIIDYFDMPLSSYKNSNNIHNKISIRDKYKIIDKYL